LAVSWLPWPATESDATHRSGISRRAVAAEFGLSDINGKQPKPLTLEMV
jgi:hypothetical protein